MFNTKICSVLLLVITYNIYATDITPSQKSSSDEQQLELALPSTDTKKQKSRMRKTHSEKKRKINTYRDMTYEELLIAKNQYIEQKNYTSAIKYLEQMMKLCNDITLIGELIIEIADLLCKEEFFQKAAQRYAEYVALYPGGEQLEYALFKAIECSFTCTLTFDRDQTKTEDTLALAESFLKQDHFTTYADQVTAIRQQCYQKLAESELNICSFYLHKGQLQPAQKRLESFRTTWLPKLPDLESTVTAYETDLLVQQEALEQKKAKAVLIAQNKNKHMAQRF